MSAVGVVFDVVDEAVASPVGHFVFGVRSGSLQRRARFVLEESSAESVVVTPVVNQLERAEGMQCNSLITRFNLRLKIVPMCQKTTKHPTWIALVGWLDAGGASYHSSDEETMTTRSTGEFHVS